MDINSPDRAIFTYVPIHDLCTAAQVCRGWAVAASHDHVWHQHVSWMSRRSTKNTLKQIYAGTASGIQKWAKSIRSAKLKIAHENVLCGVHVMNWYNDGEQDKPLVYVAIDTKADLKVYFPHTNDEKDDESENDSLNSTMRSSLIETNTTPYGIMHSYKNLLAVPVQDMEINNYTEIINTMNDELGKVEMKLKCPFDIEISTSVRFTGDGLHVLESMETTSHSGVCMWDVETGQLVSYFDQTKSSGYEQICAVSSLDYYQYKHSVQGVYPIIDGSQFVGVSNSDLYHWDARSNQMVQSFSFCSVSDLEGRKYYTNPTIHLIKNESELLLNFDDPAIIATYSFPGFVPTASQFPFTKLGAIYVDDLKGVAILDSDECVLVDCLKKEMIPLDRIKFASKPRGDICHFSGDTIAVATGNERDGLQILSASHCIK